MDWVIELFIEFLSRKCSVWIFLHIFFMCFLNLSQVIIILVDWAICPDPLLLNSAHNFEESMKVSCHVLIYFLAHLFDTHFKEHSLQVKVCFGVHWWPSPDFIINKCIWLLFICGPWIIWFGWLGFGFILSNYWFIISYWSLFPLLAFVMNVRIGIVFWFRILLWIHRCE